MVAVPVSPSERSSAHLVSPASCQACGSSISGELAPHACAQCGEPQPVQVSEGEDFFQALGVARSFRLEGPALEKRFYFLSRSLHPDRFAQRGPQALKCSIERMSLLNRAYRALKDPLQRREHLLELEGISGKKTPQAVPLDLADDWFELQDVVMESPESAPQRLQEFVTRLSQLKSERKMRVESLEMRWEESRTGTQSPDREALQLLARELEAGATLASLERDVARLTNRLGVTLGKSE